MFIFLCGICNPRLCCAYCVRVVWLHSNKSFSGRCDNTYFTFVVLVMHSRALNKSHHLVLLISLHDVLFYKINFTMLQLHCVKDVQVFVCVCVRESVCVCVHVCVRVHVCVCVTLLWGTYCCDLCLRREPRYFYAFDIASTKYCMVTRSKIVVNTLAHKHALGPIK